MKKIIVKNCIKTSTLDDFNKGEDPDTTTMVDITEYKKTFNSLKALADNYGLPRPSKEKESQWFIYEDNEIICQTLENQLGDEIFPDTKVWEKWKNGEMKLYACEYRFKISIVEEIEMTQENLKEFLKIETYD